ncbi:MAG TPA: redoxin family protein, partial [Cyclobacteriaceae bacterium]
MKKSFIGSVISLSMILLTIACQQSGKESADTSSKDSVFVPHPQKVPKQDVKTLEIGASAPDFRLPDTNGKFYSLTDFKEPKALVIVFTCNHCPTAQAYEDRLIQFTNDYKSKDVAVVAIMPNSTAGLLPEECGYTDLNDSYAEMKIRADYKKYNFPYLYDGDNQSIAIAYGPVATPHAFVFNKERKLSYVGRLDATEKPGTANAEDLRAAVDAVLADKEVATPVNKAFGCSVKWEWKGEYGKQIEKEWNEKPVTLEKLPVAGLKDLVKNSGTKLRLINIWATWCAPCVAEYPSLVELQRWYGQRDFEFVSLSADNPESFDKALAFLQKKHSPVKNYIYDATDKYKLIEAIDPKWNGALPYTLLVEP